MSLVSEWQFVKPKKKSTKFEIPHNSQHKKNNHRPDDDAEGVLSPNELLATVASVTEPLRKFFFRSYVEKSLVAALVDKSYESYQSCESTVSLKSSIEMSTTAEWATNKIEVPGDVEIVCTQTDNANYARDVESLLNMSTLNAAINIQLITALGIGKFSSPISLLQLALSVCLQEVGSPPRVLKSSEAQSTITESFSAPTKVGELSHNLGCSGTTSTITSAAEIAPSGQYHDKCKVVMFDPMFDSIEEEVCLKLGFESHTENLRGKHLAKGVTLFYMPHCPYRLYVNVLWANWHQLENVIILGNR
jgi:hypothetical protein